jgi:hypothetical protein
MTPRRWYPWLSSADRRTPIEQCCRGQRELCREDDAGHENVKAGDVVTLARQEHEAHQIAERIDERRNLRRQAAARLADGLILSPPFAPVPC